MTSSTVDNKPAESTVDKQGLVTLYTIRLRHDNGHINFTVAGHATAYKTVQWLLGVELAPEGAVVWVKRRPICDYDYCDRPAYRYERDSGDETPLCMECAKDHYGTVRAVREHTGYLGVTRLITVDESEWKDPTPCTPATPASP